MTREPIALSNGDLIAEVTHAAADERDATTALIALLVELDERRLFLGEGCSSLFMYCTRVLRLSEHAAYGRIAAARASRRCPDILTLLATGEINLTTVVLLAPHLVPENQEPLLEAARGRTKVEIEELIAARRPQPDLESRIRRVPNPAPIEATNLDAPAAMPSVSLPLISPAPSEPASRVPRPVVAPLSPERYLIKVTVSGEAHENLTRARALLRHTIPSGDPAAIIERALALLVDQLERTRHARVGKPSQPTPRAFPTRHVPASVRRVVWRRDGGRCAFVGAEGRCTETGFLEFRHIQPFADHGPTTAENLSLRCRAHNRHESRLWSGEGDALHARDHGRSTRSGPS